MAASKGDIVMFDPHRMPRPLRWYEWLAILLIAGYAARAHAAQIFRCTDVRGAVTFQDRACAASADQAAIALAPVPRYAASPEYAVRRDTPPRTAARPRRTGAASHREAPAGAGSFECRAADGQVFYRHSACPRSVAALDQPGRVRRGRAAATKSVAVTATRIPREAAGYELRRAGAASRRGRDHDEDVSTYDKNLGRDPCR